MMSTTERYQSDATFRQLVDMLYSVIDHATYTPTEVREAAMLAHILYEERRIRPILIDGLGEIARDFQRGR